MQAGKNLKQCIVSMLGFPALLRVDLQGSFLSQWRGPETVAGWRRAKGWIGRLLSQRIRPCHLGGVWAGLTSHGKAQRSPKSQGPARKQYAKEMEKKSKQKGGGLDGVTSRGRAQRSEEGPSHRGGARAHNRQLLSSTFKTLQTFQNEGTNYC